MTTRPLASRPVPRAGAILLHLAGIVCLSLGGYLAGTAIFGPDERLVFLHDARMQHASATLDDAGAKAREIQSIQRRGGPPGHVNRAIDESNRYFDEMRLVRDENLRINAKRWRRTQGLLGGWLGIAGVALIATGVREWRGARAATS